jgi:anti-sigma factor RsiW
MIATCRTTIDLLAAFVDGALSAEEEQSLRAHLADCPRCVEFLESYRGTSRVLREATALEMPPAVQRRLLAFLAPQAD